MALPRELRKAIEAAQLERVEDAWLQQIETDPESVDFFTAAARGLVGSGEGEQATFLLELLDEHLRSGERWEARLELLRGCGETLFPEPERLYREILATLRALYRDCPSLDGMIEKIGLERGTGDLPKIWDKTAKLRDLMQFELGTPVRMEGKGVGRIEEVNLELGSFKLAFDDGGELRVGFAAAPKLLDALPRGHFLRDRLERPEELRALKESRPSELLQRLLESSEEPLTAAQIREAMQGIVDEKEWTSWWAAARSHPQVVPGGRGRQTYAWAESSADALEEIRQAFERSDGPGRLKLLARHGSRDEELAGWMARRLADEGRAAADERPEWALTVWAALERSGAAPKDRTWSPEALVDRSGDLVRTVLALGDKTLRESVAALIRERRDDWPAVTRGILDRETDSRLLTSLFDALDAADGDQAQQFVDEVVGAPRRRPAAFTWLMERGADEARLERHSALALLRHLVAADGDRTFAPYRARLRRLWESGGHTWLLDRLSAEQAPRAHQVIERAPIEEYLRTPYLNALELRFPELGRRESDHLYATRASVDARRAELKELLEKEIPANRKAIEEARELGDLRENFEYKSARQRHEFLTARAAALDRDLSRVRLIDPSLVDASEVRVGTRARLTGADGEERAVTVLGPWESRPEDGIFSYDSDLARELLGKAAGDTIRLKGAEYRIGAIEPAEL
ncbi:MAG: GreA/GreB family elongation factor [Thermoanaerobaculia bacterium]|nr:GreA/GreB family elongation factor [Thermoanaerobaculia bacterium]